MNVYIKPVQDFLIPIPRTFIFYYKPIAGLAIYDIFIIGAFLYICIKYLSRGKYRRIFFSKNLLTKIFQCDLMLLFLSFLGFGIYMLGDNPVDSKEQVKCFRFIMSMVVTIFVAQMAITRYKSDKDIFRIITTLFFINFVVYFSEFISSFYIEEICWERGGHKVNLLDQTGGGLALIYVPFILCKTPYLKKWMSLSAYFFMMLLLYNVIKIWILPIGIAVFMMILWGLARMKIQKRLLLFSLVGIVAVVIFSITVARSGTDSILTRVGQSEMLYQAFSKNPINIIFGIGHGGMIKKQTMTEDGGEIRAVDLEDDKDPKYVTTYQVPFFFFLKLSGVIGMLFCLYLFIIMLKYSFSVIKYGWYFSCSIAFIAAVLLIGSRLSSADPQVGIYLGEAYVIFKLLLQHKIRIIDSKKHTFKTI